MYCRDRTFLHVSEHQDIWGFAYMKRSSCNAVELGSCDSLINCYRLSLCLAHSNSFWDQRATLFSRETWYILSLAKQIILLPIPLRGSYTCINQAKRTICTQFVYIAVCCHWCALSSLLLSLFATVLSYSISLFGSGRARTSATVGIFLSPSNLKLADNGRSFSLGEGMK